MRLITIVLTTSAILTCLINGAITVPTPGKSLSKYPVILVVSYDGFRYDYLNKVDTPILHELKAAGVSVPFMIPVFPTKTFPNHHSIATGLYAESHGIVDNTFFDPKFNKTLSGFTDDEGFWNYHPEVLPIWIQNEMAGDGRASGCMMWPGSSEPYGESNDLLPTYYYPKYDGSVPWESRVDTVISWITNDTKPANLVFLYYDEPDTHGHAFGPNVNETLNEVANADKRTEYLINKLTEVEIFDKINLILLSDHGMHEVTQKTIINITEIINPDLLQDKYGGTPLIQLVPKEGKEEELYQTLQKNMSMGYAVLTKEQLQYRFRYSESRRITDLVVVAEPGYAFDDFNKSIQNYNEKWNLTESPTREYGVHGYSNEAPSMRPFFIAHGPAFRNGFEFQPIRNIDIVPLISTIVEIPSLPNNGSLAHVLEMINPAFVSKDTNLSNTGSGNTLYGQMAFVLPIAIASRVLTILNV